jgi:hypothetical protein
MYTLLVSAISLIGTLTSAQATDPQDAQAVSGRPEPCYVVIAVDVSGTMENIDVPAFDAAGRRQTLRDEGQLVLLQLLPFLYSDLYVGVAHFSDKVRYSLPSEETGPLLPWGQTYLNESACRNLVRPAEFQASYRSEVAESMSWAAGRIRAARQRYGQGPGKLIILSSGDPYDSARELSRGGGPILTMARRLAEQQIQVYPILINEASLRSAGSQARLSGKGSAAEDLMQAVASMTGGKGYRLTRESGFADILMDVFGLGTRLQENPVVSAHDWAIVAVGAPLELVVVEPAEGAARTLAANGGLDTAPEIRANIIRSPQHPTLVLRRPEGASLVSRSWQGPWKVVPRGDGAPGSVRFYRIPDFLMRLETVPALPWWRHERVQLKTYLLDRHRTVAELPAAETAGGRGLSLHIKGTSSDEADSFLLEKGRWVVPGRVFETELFSLGTPGLYKLTCELRDSWGKVGIPILYFDSDVYVHSECVGVKVMDAITDQVLQEVPPVAGQVRIESQGGQRVYFQIAGKGEFNIEPLSGVLHLEPLPQTQWPLHKDADGQLITDRIDLVEREEGLAGWVEVDVRTFAGVRHLQLPKFEMAYSPAPLRMVCTFTDPREALWVGELHRQSLNISAFPVFEQSRNRTVRLFPETLPQARLRTVDARSGLTQVVEPASRQVEPPQPGGYEGRTITATYVVDSNVPIPAADKCEIDLSAVLGNLQGALKTYAVIDPVAEGLFRWTVQQGPPAAGQGAVAEVLFSGEPVRFSAEWRADQNVSAVRFEIPQPGSAEPLLVEAPVTPGSNKTQIERSMPGLSPGQTLPLYVHLTLQPAGAEHALQIKLKGGQFRAADRRLALKELVAGDGTPTDIAGYAWEPVEVPLRVVFNGYTAGDPRHTAAIEQFKKSCAVVVTPRAGEAQNITGTVEWLSVTADGAARTCALKGHALYTPAVTGRATVELTGESLAAQGPAGPSVQHAYAHVLVREPRLAVAVQRLTPAGEEPLFDSRTWVRGEGTVSALATRLSTRLRLDIQSGDATAGQPTTWKTAIRLLRRAAADGPWTAVFSDASELAPNASFTREVQITENGEYALEITGHDPQAARRGLYVLTPVLASIQQYEVKPAVAPPAWLSSRVRQWPFEYHVTLRQDGGGLSRAQAAAFQFQLPGQSETWMEGTTASVKSEGAEAQQVAARAPQFLPAVDTLSDGKVQFRLSAQGLEFLRWECPGVRVVPPVFEGLVLSHTSTGGAMDATPAELASNGATDLWVRPVFRAAPELEGQWVPSDVTVYVWRDRTGGPAGRPADVRVLEELWQRGQTDQAGVQTFRIPSDATEKAVKILPRRVRRSFWGWPRPGVKERYSVIASVAYHPKPTSASPAGPSAAPAERMIAEWSNIYALNLDTPWVVPFLWWPLAVVLLAAVVTTVLRLFVPSPSKLGLDLRLEENVAIVEPVRLDNPVLLDLHETSFAREVQLYTRFLCGKWGMAGREQRQRGSARLNSVGGAARSALLVAAATVVGPVSVFLRRVLYARRCAWAAIIPRVRGNAQRVHTALLCVWAGPAARRGRAWSSQGGTLELPPVGRTTSLSLDLPYQADGVDRNMRVTVRVRRLASEQMETTAPGWPQTSSELSS